MAVCAVNGHNSGLFRKEGPRHKAAISLAVSMLAPPARTFLAGHDVVPIDRFPLC